MRESEAREYLRDHHIMELFENFTTALVYERPDDPKAFLKDYIDKLQRAQSVLDVNQDAKAPCLIDESNLQSIFGMLDITHTGFISQEQYLKAMTNLGVTRFNQNPVGGESNRITVDTFVREAEVALRKVSETYV